MTLPYLPLIIVVENAEPAGTYCRILRPDRRSIMPQPMFIVLPSLVQQVPMRVISATRPGPKLLPFAAAVKRRSGPLM